MICDVLGFAASKLACIPACHEAGARNRLVTSVPSRPMDFNDVVYLCSSTTMEKSLSSGRLVVSSDVDEKTELRMIALFRAHDLTGWQRNAKLFREPDFSFPTHRVPYSSMLASGIDTKVASSATRRNLGLISGCRNLNRKSRVIALLRARCAKEGGRSSAFGNVSSHERNKLA